MSRLSIVLAALAAADVPVLRRAVPHGALLIDPAGDGMAVLVLDATLPDVRCARLARRALQRVHAARRTPRC